MIGWGIKILFWCGLMWGALQVQKLEIGHALCGAWGCGPPLEALLAMHLFWLSFLVPPVVLVLRHWKFSNKSMKLAGWLTIAIAVAGLVAFLFYDWSIHHTYYEAGYWWQRYALSLASLVEVPILQTLLLGIATVATGKFLSPKQAPRQVVQDPLEYTDFAPQDVVHEQQ